MKITFNCHIKNDTYGILYPGKEYDLPDELAEKYLSKKLDKNGSRMTANLVSLRSTPEDLKKSELKLTQTLLKNRQKKLKIKETLIKTNEKKKSEVKARLKKLAPEKANIKALEKKEKELSE